MRRIYLTILALSIIFVTSCVPLVLVGGGAAVGYSLSGDSAMGNVKATYRGIWDNAVETLNKCEAEILISNESKGFIKAKVSDYTVMVKIDTITEETQKLKVSARKYLMPKPQFAQKIFLKITENLE